MPALRVTADPKGGSIAEKTDDTQAKARPAATVLASSTQSPTQTTQDANSPKSNKDGWDKAAVLSNYLLVAVGIAGIIYAAKTLRKLKEQTQAAIDAAETARDQTNHMIASERAWLVISSVNDNSSFVWSGAPRLYWWHVRNVGNTPAILLETQAVCRVAETVQLEGAPQFSEPVILSKRMLAPGDSIDFNTFWSDQRGVLFRQQVEEIDPLILLSFGYIKYKTVLDPKIREARFCDAWFAEGNPRSHSVQPMIFRPWLAAPPEYTKHT